MTFTDKDTEMKLHLDSGDNLLRVSAYDGASVTVADMRRTSTFALTPQILIEDLTADSVDGLSWAQFPALHEQDIEILILGTGREQRFPDRAFFAELAAARIGLEVMDTGAACRTYNILAAEGRRVAAILMLGC